MSSRFHSFQLKYLVAFHSSIPPSSSCFFFQFCLYFSLIFSPRLCDLSRLKCDQYFFFLSETLLAKHKTKYILCRTSRICIIFINSMHHTWKNGIFPHAFKQGHRPLTVNYVEIRLSKCLTVLMQLVYTQCVQNGFVHGSHASSAQLRDCDVLLNISIPPIYF